MWLYEKDDKACDWCSRTPPELIRVAVLVHAVHAHLPPSPLSRRLSFLAHARTHAQARMCAHLKVVEVDVAAPLEDEEIAVAAQREGSPRLVLRAGLCDLLVRLSGTPAGIVL